MGRQATTPKRYRLYAIGDIHGRRDLLARLIDMIALNAQGFPEKEKRIIFLGDYVDRGVDPKGVLDYLCKPFLAKVKPIFLRGNHEDALLRFLGGEMDVAPIWLKYGGATTLASYGLNPHPLDATLENQDKILHLREQFAKVLPLEHRAFLDRTLYSTSYGDYFFCHAGVRPGVPLSDQKAHDLMWIRKDFISYPKGMGKMIVHGHTIVKEPALKPNRIAIDTGAYASGRLTCLIMDGNERSFLST